MRAIVFTLLVTLSSLGFGQDIFIRDGRVVTNTDAGVIERGNILVSDGEIVAVGAGIEMPAGALVVDAGGNWVTPGFFDSNTQIGLGDVESSSVRSDHRLDGSDLGAGFRVSLGIDRYSLHIPITRLEGVTRAIVRPSPGSEIFAGQSAILALADRDVIVDGSNAVFAWIGEDGRRYAAGSRAKAMMDLVDAIEETAKYVDNRRAYESRRLRDLRQSQLDLEALVSVVEGDKPLAVYVHRDSDIEVLIEELAPFDINLIIVGGGEAWKVRNLLADNDIPVVLNPMDNAPGDFDETGVRLDAPKLLTDAGVTVAFMTEDLFSDNRTLSQGAGVSVAYGLSWEDALAAVTINPARIWGISDEYGSLARGQQADVVIWDGDPLEVMSAPVYMLIRGVPVELTSRQMRLRDRYSDLENPKSIPFGYRD